MPAIFVIGSSNTDMVVKSGKLPAAGETIIGGRFLMNAGGKGANQAVAAAKLGASVTFACKTGNDIFGAQAVSDFQKAGINTSYVLTDNEQPSGVALILVDDKGENSISVASGANGNLHIAELDDFIDQINKGDIVLLQLEIPVPTVEQAIRRCHAKGAVVILNPAPAQKLDGAVFSFINIITPNETEAELLTNKKVTDINTAEAAATVLQNMGVATVIITMGAKGAYLHSGSIKKLIPALIVTAIDTTAAGDVFNGALAVALSENKELEHAVHFACKAAAIAVTRMGAQASAPTRDEIQPD